MRFDKKVFLRYMMIGIIFPFIVQYVFYFRYTSNYMPNSFSENGFNSTYNENIFRYRILGRNLHLWLYHQMLRSEKIRNFKEEPIYSKRLTALDANADETFYLTYFILAVSFSVLSSLALLYLFDMKGFFVLTNPQKIFIVSGLIMLIGFMQFTMTPYDNISYFLLITASILLFKYLEHKQWIYFLLLNLCIILHTLNHESSFVDLSLIASVYVNLYGLNKSLLRFMLVPSICFLLTYISLRVLIPNNVSNVSAEGIKFWHNFGIKKLSSLIGILFSIITFYFLLNSATELNNKKLVRNFILMALPYIIIIPIIGIMIELRLWMPVLLGGFLLSQVNLIHIKPNKQIA